MKNLIYLFQVTAAILVLTPLASAESKSAFCRGGDTRSNCVAAGVASVASGGSAIFALKKYKQHDLAQNGFEKAHTKVLMDLGDRPQVLNENKAADLSRHIGDGDKVTVVYNLGDAENRAHHISTMEESAHYERSKAKHYRKLADQALNPKSVYEDVMVDGKIQKVLVSPAPDTKVHKENIALAREAEKSAKNFAKKAKEARAGKLVPVYDLVEVLGAADQSPQEAQKFLSRAVNEGLKIKKVTRLPALHFAQLKRTLISARAGVAGAAVTAGVALKEIAVDGLADKIENSETVNATYRPYSETSSGGAVR